MQRKLRSGITRTSGLWVQLSIESIGTSYGVLTSARTSGQHSEHHHAQPEVAGGLIRDVEQRVEPAHAWHGGPV